MIFFLGEIELLNEVALAHRRVHDVAVSHRAANKIAGAQEDVNSPLLGHAQYNKAA